MHCDECEYRFKCFTLADDERPKRIKINWKIHNTCGRCKNVKFLIKVENYRTIKRPVGFCAVTGMLVHKSSAACKDYKPLKMAQIDKIYKEINEVISLKNKKTKLPKYCIEE